MDNMEEKQMLTKNKSEEILSEIGKVVIGQDDFVRNVLTAFFAGGHILMEGVPGLGKTLLAKALAQSLGFDFKRVSFTPDLMPSDIVGTKVFSLKDTEFHLKKGPVFTNVFLADEINRTPPKTQSALLEAMEERAVTIDGETHRLADTFFVIATQNPVEYEGTYPLPEAQVDRFLMKLNIEYFAQEAENALLKKYCGDFVSSHADVNNLHAVITEEELAACRKEIASVIVNDEIINYITSIVNGTRKSPAMLLGASPRASIALLLCAKASAAMAGRDFVVPEDVVDVAIPVLRHRVILRPEAGVDGMNADTVLKSIIGKTEVPR